MTQSIIVYRNPLEAAIWESGLVGPFILSGLVFVLVFAGIVKLAGRHAMYRSKRTTIIQWIAAIVAFAIAATVFVHITA
jgi:hypothetical protein